MINKKKIDDRNVLIVAYVFPPIAYVGTYRTLRFCKYLPENGWIPHVLTIKEGRDLHNDHNLLCQIPEQVKIYRTYTIDFWRLWNLWRGKRNKGKKKSVSANGNKDERSYRKKNIGKVKKLIWEFITTPDHMVFWIPFAVLKGAKIIYKKKCELIYSTSPPHSEHFSAYILTKLFKKRWIADFRDPMLDSSGYEPATKIRRWVDKVLEGLIVKNAHKVLVISNHYNSIIGKRYPFYSHKFITMPNGFDPVNYKTTEAEYYKKFTILYSGSFYANRKPSFFLKGLKEWLLTRPQAIDDIKVIFHGLESSELRETVDALELNSIVHVKGLISQDELIKKQKGAHLLLLIIGFDAESKGTVTSKVFEYMACNRPILAIIPEGNALEILKDYEKLYLVKREERKLLISNLNKAYDRYKANHDHFKKQKFSEYEKSPYNAQMQTKKVAKLFSNIAIQRDS